MTVDPKGFLVAFGIFASLLLIAILVDREHWVTDPAAYTGMASTALGAVLGFVTGEASGASG